MSQRMIIAGVLVGLWVCAGCGASKSTLLIDADRPALDAEVDKGQPALGLDASPKPVADASLVTSDTSSNPVLDTAPKPVLDTAPKATWPSGKNITVDEVYAHLTAADASMLLVNVVDAQYYNLGFISGSLKIPWDALAGRLGELDSSRNIVLYCRKGVRSESAYTTLKDKSFPHVWVMEGGIERWIAAGYPTVAQ